MKNVCVILSHPSHPGNIGATARALKNMGLTDLILVAPREFPHPVATARAAGAEDVLRRAQVVATLTEALAECQHVVAVSGKQPELALPAESIRMAAPRLSQYTGKIGFLFGRENNGLSSAELYACQERVFIPTAAYNSLNLAQAVQVITYELLLSAQTSVPIEEARELATHKEREGFYQHLFDVLEKGAFFDRRSPKKLVPRLRRLFARALLDKTEINILRGILTTFENRLP